MVHRDVKPENVLMDDQIAKIADFGLARSCKWRALTQSANLKGTVAYMPPEQFTNFRHTDVRGDIYSLGKILYEAIAGKIGSKDNSIHFKTVRLENPASPFFEKLNGIVEKATAKKKEERFQTAGELKNALIDALSTPRQAKNPGSEREEASPRDSKIPRWLRSGIVVVALSVVPTISWYFFGGIQKSGKAGWFPNPKSAIVEKESGIGASDAGTGTGDNSPGGTESGRRNGLVSNVVSPISTKDGATMCYVPGGLPADEEARIEGAVEPFFMDEAPVTNRRYVDTLFTWPRTAMEFAG